MWPTAIITICKYLIGSWWCVNRSILCPSGPQWKANLRSTSVQVKNTWPLGYSITRLRVKTENLHQFWSLIDQKWSFLCMQTNWVCRSEPLRFCKNDSESSLESLIVTRVESFCEKHDSRRVESPSFSTWLESSQSHQKSWLESSHWLESRYHCRKLTAMI